MQTATGRIQQEGLSDTDRHWSMWTHLSVLLAFMVIGPFAAVAPLAMWLSRRRSSVFVDDHGREVMNMSLTGVVLLLLGMVTGIGMIAWLVWVIVTIIALIRGAVAASNGEYFRYPMTIRFIN
jgi:uncharacterized Tic20 family protein